MLNAKEATAKKEEKLSELLTTAEDHPLMKAILAEKAAAIQATRTEAAGKIEALKKERDEVIPKLLADRDAKEEKFKKAKAALDAAGGEYQTARSVVTSRNQFFDNAISRQETILLETADPEIDAAILFFQDRLAFLRTPGRISMNRIGAERNVFTEKVTTRVESNYDAVNAALRYCLDAVQELQQMKRTVALDLQKIEGMKKGIPDINVYSESTAEKPMPGSVGMPAFRPRFGGAASDEYEQTLIDRVLKKAADFVSKPTLREALVFKDATLQMYQEEKRKVRAFLGGSSRLDPRR
jgi:chromosome segregation ATPase